MGFEGFPFIIGWELTLACNLKCRHCASTAGRQRVQELSLDESLAICDQFPDLLVYEVNFTGGEPLLQSSWKKIAAYLGELDIRTKIITHGGNLDSKTINQMKDVGIAGVGISLDGVEITHDYIRNRPGLFRQVLAGIETVLNADLSLTVITAVNGRNMVELPSLFTLLQSYGVERWQIQPVFHLGRFNENSDLQLTNQEYLNLGSFIKECMPNAEKTGLDIVLSDSYGYFTELDLRKYDWSGCQAGQVSCGITSDGKVKGCLSLPDNMIEGDLRQQDLWDIWFHPNGFSYTRHFSVDKLGPLCKSCDKGEKCKGGCSAMSYGCTERFHNNPYCFYGIRKRNQSRLHADTHQKNPKLE